MTTARVAGRAFAVLVGLAVLLLPAAPASADAPKPTDYRSEVLHITPALPAGMTAQVVGGDSFLELSVPRGHRVVVPDYAAGDDEHPAPYLRFQADGTVQRNRLAIATAANESRFGTSDRQPDPTAAPEWETVATGGTYAWHDHRIHWMSPTPPRGVSADGRVDLGGKDGTWSVPIVVDGTPTTITGQLVLLPSPSPLPWVALAVVVLAAGLFIGVRWGLSPVAAIAVVVASAAVGVSWATWTSAPASTGVSWIPIAVSLVAVVAALAAVWSPPRVQFIAIAATAAALVGWGLSRWTVLTKAVLPTTLPYGLDRAVTSGAFGVGLALAALLLWKPPARSRPPAASLLEGSTS
ncbi:hypothetical protein [Aquihabitans sp. McL0605]|uniref:hypothetical protein n=1 Tax=Aquihabitans sp. McL0605 TaxID=3415671 RepID=UPI003CEB4CA0